MRRPLCSLNVGQCPTVSGALFGGICLPVVVVVLLCLGLAVPASAQQGVVGYVRTIDGEARLIRNGEALVPALGDPVEAGDEVETDGDGAMGITLLDNSQLSFGPNTRFTLDEFRFEPVVSEFSLIGSIVRGTLVFISGEIANFAPDRIRFNTPTGIIGVRGTRFAVSIAEPVE